MANVIIKSAERKEHEAYVLQSFNKGGGTTTNADREAADCIAARTREAHETLKRMEEKRR